MTRTGAPSDLELLRVRGFEAPHAFTTRSGGVSRGPYRSLDLGLSTGDVVADVRENRRRVLRAAGADPTRVAQVHQVHGATVIRAQDAAPEARADALISDDPAWTLVVSYADCVPVLLFDPVAWAVAAIHAGWRGMARGVVGAAVRAMSETYGCHPSDVHAAIGPAISGAVYQVGPEVIEAFAAAGFEPGHAHPDPEIPGRYRLDMPAATGEALHAAGVPAGQVRDGRWCTLTDATRFYSHRRDGPRTGRHWALVRLPDER